MQVNRASGLPPFFGHFSTSPHSTHPVQEVDMGVYTCAVSAWSVNGQGELVKLAEQQSSPHTVQWTAKRKKTLLLIIHS